MRTKFPGISTACLFLLAAGLFHACDREPEAPPEAPPETRESPVRDAVVVAPARPIPAGDAGPLERTEPNSSPPPDIWTEALVARVQRGMTPDQVCAILGSDGVAAGGDGGGVIVLRWEDPEGQTFTARFDDGALRTHSGLQHKRAAVAPAREARNGPEAPPKIDGRPVAEIAPGVFIPLERAVAAANSQPKGTASVPIPTPAAPANTPLRWTSPTPAMEGGETPESGGPTMVVAGASRRAGQPGTPKDRSYRPRARLPVFTRSLREGRFEIRLLNPADTPMTVGLRQDKLGRDATVAPKGQASVFVDKGVYGLYFLRGDEPYTLYEATPITIDGFLATDVEVHLSTDDVEVRQIDYSKPE